MVLSIQKSAKIKLHHSRKVVIVHKLKYYQNQQTQIKYNHLGEKKRLISNSYISIISKESFVGEKHGQNTISTKEDIADGS